MLERCFGWVDDCVCVCVESHHDELTLDACCIQVSSRKTHQWGDTNSNNRTPDSSTESVRCVG